jgi:hypothetical protein
VNTVPEHGDLAFLFPKPLTYREEMTFAEKAFFREVKRLLQPIVGGAVSLSITDGTEKPYALSVKWPDGSMRAEGDTPGEALAALMERLQPV